EAAMRRLGTFQMLLLAGCAGAAGGGGLLTLANARLPEPPEHARIAGESAVPSLPAVFLSEFPICHSASVVRAIAGRIRLAQVEVPPGGLQAIEPAPAF